MIFKEAADDLFQATLTNKSKQDTCWVRAELRSLQAYLRNIPVFYTILGKEILECYESHDTTCQKLAQKRQDEISSTSHLLFAIGLCQILECYAKTSLNAQKMTSFPTTVTAS